MNMKQNKIMTAALSLLLAGTLLAGCGQGQKPDTGSTAAKDPTSTTASVESSTPETTAAEATTTSNHTTQKATLITYKLPDVSYKAPQKEVIFTPEGLIGIPKNNNAPVVFILHGSHDMTEGAATPFYKGFEYLVKALAEQGYLAISINVNQAYLSVGEFGDDLTLTQAIFREHYNNLVKAVNGEQLFDMDLTGKADLNKINLIGHSRGGENITAIIQDTQFKDISFTSAVKIAPSLSLNHKYSYVDIPTAVVLPQYDEDVIDLNGYWDYYYAYDRDIIRKSPITTAYLYGGNHAYFNTKVTPISQAYAGETISLLKPETEQEFLVKYALDFLNIYNYGKAKLTDVFNDQTPKRYGIDFMPAVLLTNRDRLITPLPPQTGLTVNHMTLTYQEHSYQESLNQTGPFRMPGLPERFPLYRLDWDDNTGILQIPIDYIYYKFEANSVLSLYLALNSPDSRNQEEKDTIISVTITDVNNQTETIQMSSADTPALRYQPGKLSDTGFNYKQWDRYSPLGTAFIDLNSCKNIRPADGIAKIEIRPVSKTGSIMLGGIDSYHLEETE